MARQPRHIVIIQGHPDAHERHFGHALAQAYADGAHAAGHTIDTIAVAALDFPLLRSRRDHQSVTPPEAIVQAQAVMLRADHLVMIFPVWNGAMPALLKGFLEQAFRPTFTFPDAKPGAPLGFRSFFTERKALAGTSGRIVATMQMPALIYRWYFRPHPEKTILSLGGVSPLRESPIGLVDRADGRNRERWLRKMQGFGHDAR